MKERIYSQLFSYPTKFPGDEECLAIELSPPSCELLQLQNEYVKIFINDVPTVTSPPYSSYYLEGSYCGVISSEIKKLYLRYGFTIEEELPDHLAVELEFLTYLLHTHASIEEDKESEAIEEDIQKMITHLQTWVPLMVKSIEKHHPKSFYCELAKAFLQYLTPNTSQIFKRDIGV
ncbi:MAG: molecular chaperone TorD family protein [Oligoflexia bacterium]|nr:molecular chaperone TorD family protein [Oligoflexia bacterium]